LNSSNENEKLLGYDLYGTAIADTLSEPFLTMPIIVGMFAKWGSGKSFLLNKLKGILSVRSLLESLSN
jgi:ankyrin repeat-rich membrane spanning protein